MGIAISIFVTKVTVADLVYTRWSETTPDCKQLLDALFGRHQMVNGICLVSRKLRNATQCFPHYVFTTRVKDTFMRAHIDAQTQIQIAHIRAQAMPMLQIGVQK